MSAKSTLLNAQRVWAQSRGLEVDDHGYLATHEHNLWRPLSPSTQLAFERAGGSELGREGSRAKMAALHSSAALAVNFFESWKGYPLDVLVKALVLPEQATSIEFEGQFPTGLGGTPPNLDLVVHFIGGAVTGIESKFTEWLTPKSPNKEPFKPKYFVANDATPVSLWSSVGLPRCQALAADIDSRAVSFRYLDAAQLLKHALGLATSHPGKKFSLYYLYYEMPGTESAIHRKEAQDFEKLVGEELHFQWKTYQDLFRSVARTADPEHSGYVEYLRHRYFSNES